MDSFKKDYGVKILKGRTKNMPISVGHVGGSAGFEAFIQAKVQEGKNLGLSEKTAHALISHYGSNINELFGVIQNGREDAERANLPIEIYAEVWYAITKEFVCTPVDFFWRRTGALLFDIDWVTQWKEPVTELLSDLLGWSEEVTKEMTEEFERTKRLCAGLPVEE